MADAAKCSQCNIEIDDPGDDWDPETDVCINCLASELQEQRDAARREIEELKKEMDADWDEFSQVNRQTAAHIEKLTAELAELRPLVEAFGDHPLGGLEWMDFVHNCCAYNRKRKATT